MTNEKLYDIIKSWHHSCDTAGLYLVAKDFDEFEQLDYPQCIGMCTEVE